MSKTKERTGALKFGTIVKSQSDSYLIEGVLGAGGFGITYKVCRLSDHSIFAMKEYFPDLICERGDDSTITILKTNSNAFESGIDNFITEAERLSRQKISHPNIVTINEVFKTNNTAYYCMEYVEGGNIRQYVLQNGPLSLEQAKSVMRPILKAVATLHHNKITHLDIKHDNIILTRTSEDAFRPVLIDFGQSKHYDKKGKATSRLTNAGCSDGFAPQEQYLGLTEFTPQADIYALGATMLYMLTGKQPVRSSEISASIIESLLGDKVPSDIVHAITRSMRSNKNDRTPNVESLAADLCIDITEINNSEGNVTRLLNLDTQSRFNFRKYHKTIKPLVGFVCLTIIFGGLYIWYRNRPTLTQSEILTEAISKKDSEKLKRFAEADSIRAFAPYAQILFEKGDYETSMTYATKAMNSNDSISASNLLFDVRRILATNKENILQHDSTVLISETDMQITDDRNESAKNTTTSVGTDVTRYNSESKPNNPRNTELTVVSSKPETSVNPSSGSETQKTMPSSNQNNIASNNNNKSPSLRLNEALNSPNKRHLIGTLAEVEHYAPAYYHYAKLLISTGQTAKAKHYLLKSIAAGSNVKQSQETLDLLDN